MKKTHNTDTIIRFKFLKPGGFRVGASDGTGKKYGNFFPKQGPISKQIPGMKGNTWEVGYKLDHIFDVELESEVVRGLPSHIAQHSDDAVKTAYRNEQAKVASEAHHRNNAIRDELAHYTESGLIEIISDSFMDEKVVEVELEPITSPRSPGRPKKEVTE